MRGLLKKRLVFCIKFIDLGGGGGGGVNSWGVGIIKVRVVLFIKFLMWNFFRKLFSSISH